MKAIYRADKEPHQLDRGEWCNWQGAIYACCPGDLIANLGNHKITVTGDHALTVEPSILCNGAPGESFHGFIENGIWLDEAKKPLSE